MGRVVFLTLNPLTLLYAYFNSNFNSSGIYSNIHLVHPLTKEQISNNNGGGGNWGGHGKIVQVDNDGVVLHILYEGEDF